MQGVTISITALGEVPRGSALLRSGALAGDEIWVSGTLGDGALGLACRRGTVEAADAASPAIARLERPEPRVGLGERLRGIASSAIDVSDGLAGDLGHILETSGVAAAVRIGILIGVRETDVLVHVLKAHVGTRPGRVVRVSLCQFC